MKIHMYLMIDFLTMIFEQTHLFLHHPVMVFPFLPGLTKHRGKYWVSPILFGVEYGYKAYFALKNEGKAKGEGEKRESKKI